MAVAKDQRSQAIEIATCLSKGNDEKLWDDAKRSFIEKNKPKKETSSEAQDFAVFIGRSENVGDMRRMCQDVQKTADAKYTTQDVKIKGKTILPGTWLKSTVNAMDMFISVGDVAFKGGSETLSLGWTAVKWVLQAVKADADRCAIWAEASEMISRILLTCRTIGKMFSEASNTAPTELVQQLLKDIPNVYESILAYSWAAKKQVERSSARRMLSSVNPLSSAAAASKGAFEAIKGFYQRIREDGQVAFNEYAKEALKSLDKGQQEVIMSIRESFDSSQKQMQEFSEVNKELLEEVKKLRPLTPYQADLQTFEVFKRRLEASNHSGRSKDRKIESREPGTCMWIFDNREYREWFSSDQSRLLRISAGSGFGKSVLTSTVIERLLSDANEDKRRVVAYYFCEHSESTDGTQKASRLIQDVIFRLYDHAKAHEDALAEINRLFKKNESKDEKQTASKPGSGRVRKTVDFLGNPDETFVAMAKIVGHEVFLVIDALDECTDRIEEEFFNTLHTWIRDSGSKVKILLSSRPETDIVKELEQYPSIDVARCNQPDLARRTDSALSVLVNLSPVERRRIRQTMLDKAEGQFTYIDLAINILQQPWIRPVDNIISKFQDGVARLHQETLRSTDPNYKDLAEQILTWTLLKCGDLQVGNFFDIYTRRYTAAESIEEQDVAVANTDKAIENGEAESGANGTPSDAEEDDAASEEKEAANRRLYFDQVQKAARTFIRITANDVLQEQHQNVPESFLSDKIDPAHNPGFFYINKEEAHLKITLELLKALNSESFCKDYMSIDSNEDSEEATTAKPEDQALSNPWDVWKPTGPVQDPADEATDGKADEAATEESSGATDSSNASDDAQKSADTSQTSVEGGLANDDAASNENKTIGEENQITTTEEGDPSKADEDKQDASPEFNYDVDSDDGDLEDSLGKLRDFDDDTGPVSQVTMRYEVGNWFKHLKAAELAAGDNQKVGGLWEEVWKELRAFVLNESRFRAWCQAFDATKGDSSDNWVVGMAGNAEIKFTPYHVFVTLGLTWAIRRMIDDGADIAVRNHWDDFPVAYYAIDPWASEDLDLLKLLLQHNNINEKDPKEQGSDYPFLYFLWWDPSVAVLRTLVDAGAHVDITALDNTNSLHYVARNSTRPDVARFLIEKGVDINALDEDGNSPLHVLLQRSDLDEEMLDVFLTNGADVRQESNESEQPLVGAAASGQLKAVRLLLKEGPGRKTADVNDEDNHGKTALHMAAYHGQTEIVQCLVEHGANVNHKSHKGSTPLFNAAEGQHEETSMYLFNELVARKYTPHEIDQKRWNDKTVLRQASLSGVTELVKAMLDVPGIQERIDMCDQNRNWTPLHVASLMGRDKVVEILIAKGAQITEDKRGKTPLRLCCERWNLGLKENREAIALMLVNQDPDPAIIDNIALFTGAAMGSVKLVQRLLEIGVNPNIVDDHGWKPVHVARYNNHTTLVQALEHGGIFGFAPSRLVVPADQPEVIYDDATATYSGTDKDTTTKWTLVADHPIRVGESKFYYEVAIQPKPRDELKVEDCWVAIGLAQSPPMTRDWMPGWPQQGGHSYGWHGDDGCVFGNTGWGKTIDGFTPYAYGDTIGCGFDSQAASIFYTRNGELVGTPFAEVSGRLFPCVGLRGEMGIQVNFAGPFQYEAINALARSPTSDSMREGSPGRQGPPVNGQVNGQVSGTKVEADATASVVELGKEVDALKLTNGVKQEEPKVGMSQWKET